MHFLEVYLLEHMTDNMFNFTRNCQTGSQNGCIIFACLPRGGHNWVTEQQQLAVYEAPDAYHPHYVFGIITISKF